VGYSSPLLSKSVGEMYSMFKKCLNARSSRDLWGKNGIGKTSMGGLTKINGMQNKIK